MKLVIVLALCLSVLVAVAAANNLSAQTTTTSPDATTTTIGNDTTSPTTTSMTSPFASASPATSTGTPVVLNVVEITRMVPAGTTAGTAFTVPAGQTLIITDALVTNTSETAICGAAINRAAGAAAAAGTPATTGTAATPGTTGPTVAGTITQSDSSITGPLCVAPRTTTPLPFTTGIEFGPGQTVQLMNVPDATTTTGAAAATPGAVGFHLRGMLVAT